jgi:hypothetical protein
MAKWRPIEFLASAGPLGISSVGLATVLFVISIMEHTQDKNVPATIFFVLGGLVFCYGAYLAWSHERDRYLELEKSIEKADLRGQIVRASIDVWTYKDRTWHSLDSGISVTVLVEAVNHGQVDCWFGKWPTISIRLGDQAYAGSVSEFPAQEMEYNDSIVIDKRIFWFFQRMNVGNSDMSYGKPKGGWIRFWIPEMPPGVLESEVHASIQVTLFDSLGAEHLIETKDVVLSRNLVIGHW